MDAVKKIQGIWKIVDNNIEIITLTRFSLLIVVAAGFALLVNAQVRDLLVGAGDDLSKCVFFLLAVIWWSLQSWGWSRFILTKVYGDTRSGEDVSTWLINYLPRIYGVASVIVAAVSAYTAQAGEITVYLLIIAVLLFFFYVKRRPLMVRYKRIQVNSDQYLYITYVVIFMSTLYAIISPVSMGNMMGAGAVTFLGLGSLIPIGTLLICKFQIVTTQNNRTQVVNFPIISLLLITAAVFSLFNDNHRVRYYPGVDGQPEKAMASIPLSDAYKRWANINNNIDDDPLIIVATAGGGLRATYWTGVILGALEEQIDDFHKKVFAISGVSGGSLGAVMYNTALNLKPTDKHGFQEELLAAMGKDYLAPTIASMLYGDLLQRFLPIPPSMPALQFSDRAQALEQGWEQGFSDVYDNGEPPSLAKPFREMFKLHDEKVSNDWVPLLFLNGTSQETGKRIITSPVEIDPTIFYDSYDFYQLNNNVKIAASTAAHNSARFTYVSPAGTIDGKNKDKGHVIDGGYFENYGATTVSNILSRLKKEGLYKSGRKIIVIVISNDIGIKRSDYNVSKMPSNINKKTNHFLNEVLAPIFGMINTRPAHGLLAYKLLEAQTKSINAINDDSDKAKFLHFSIKKLEEGSLNNEKYNDPPLGWVLSESSKDNMRSQFYDISFNHAEFVELCTFVSCRNN